MLSDLYVNKAMGDDDMVRRGHLLYSTQCGTCHGANGLGLAQAPNLTQLSATHDFKQLYGMVASGNEVRGMPAWEKMIQPEDIVSVIVYIKRVLEPASRAL